MKSFCTAVGFATLLMAGSANAAVIYDTITGQTEENLAGGRDSLRPVASANKGPLGDEFTAAINETLRSVTLRLRNTNTVTDAGSVLVYLVPSSGSGSSSSPSVSSGTTLASKVLLGTILDTAITPLGTGTPQPGAYANISLTTSALLSAGSTYWIELVDAADPVNGNGNSVSSLLKWGLNNDVLGLGVPGAGNNIVSWANPTNTGLAAFTRANDPFNPSSETGGGEVFELQLAAAPEPASMALLGAGLVGLGLARRRNKKSPG